MPRSEPRLAQAALGFELGDLALVAHRQADVVPAVQQALLAEGIDVELDAAAVWPANLLLLEIDADDGIGAALGIVHQFVDLGLRESDRQDAVLEAVVVED